MMSVGRFMELVTRIGRMAVIALGCLLGAQVASATDIDAPRHEQWAPMTVPYSVKGTSPTVPSSSPIAMKTLDQTCKELINGLVNKLPGMPMSGQNYYNTVAGESMGAKTIASSAKTASFLDKAMKGLVTDASEVSDAIKDMTDFGTARMEMVTEWLDNIHPHLFMKGEMAENAMHVFEMYKVLRSVQMMAKAWKTNGSLVKIDLLDIIPSYTYESDDPRDPSVRLKLTYTDSEHPSSIYAAMGVNNPFVGSWSSPRFTYKGPRSFSDLSIKVEASPYVQKDKTDPSVNTTTAEMEGMNKTIDRYFFEGTMGGAAAQMGVKFNADGSVYNRPSPMVLQTRAQEVAAKRIAQIKQEKSALSQLGVPTASLDAKYDAEESFWLNWPTNLKENQTARMNRIRGELQTTNTETAKAESGAKLSNEASRIAKDASTGFSFLDNLYNTYKSIGETVSNISSAVTGKEDPETSGPRMVWKANVQYTLSTFDAYHEAAALRKILYSREKARMQNQAAQPLKDLKAKADQRTAKANALDGQVSAYLEKAQRLMDMMTELFPDEDAATVMTEITDTVKTFRTAQ